ncbi:MAG: ABC transporter substrate-binding protein [Candidatus Promineofilum sp.]|nr:ABC transporter substrate-binding protein [Promineifilum sp.]
MMIRFSSLLRPAVALLAGLFLIGCAGASSDGPLVIGLNLELTGAIPKVGEHSKVAAEMFVEQINAAGGLEVGGHKHRLELAEADNTGTAEGATTAAERLIADDVLVLVGPNASVAAVPAGAVANEKMTPMISPWSTNPATTLGRQWVFRVPFIDSFQGPILASFAGDEFGAERACVLYAADSDAPRGVAGNFRDAWEQRHGPGSVVAFESFTTGDETFADQLAVIAAADCQVLFTPQYYNEVPLIVREARALGLTMPIIGNDGWSDPQLLELCGTDCDGTFYGAHYIAAGATGATKAFIDAFEARTGETPSDVGALTWDAMQLVAQAIQNCGELTGELVADRDCVRVGLTAVHDFEGITGRMSFDGEGDPIKCMVIATIEGGQASFYKSACP